MKSILLAGAALAFATTAVSPVLAKPAKAPAKSSAKRAAKPQLGSFGVDLTGMDKTVAPGDDFYKFVNGKWMARTEIPADRSSWGGFAILRNLSDERTRSIIEDAAKTQNAPGSVMEKIGVTYATFMDEAAIEAKGAAPLKPYLDAIAAISTPRELAQAMALANRRGLDMPIGVGIQQNIANNMVYAVYAGQGGLGMPDRDYYLKDDAKSVETRAKYLTHIAAMLKLAGLPDPDGAAKRIYDFEYSIAQVQWSKAELRQVEKLFNPMPAAALSTKMPGFDWTTMLAESGLAKESVVIVTQPSALTATAKILDATPMPVLKEYLAYHTITNVAPLLSKAFVTENFAFYGTTLSGTPQLKDRWKRGVDLVNTSLGEAVGQVYVERYFPPAAKAKADELVRNLIAAMDIRLSKLTWMAPETKVKARAKLAAFTPKIGYPDKWRDYSTLNVVPGDALGNAERVADFNYQRQLDKMGKPVDRSEWFMTPQTVNAYANPLMNEVVFPAAILQPPFFDPNADPAVNYGGIGAVIGHEISHHFDDQGRKFDMKGNFAEWWTAEDVKRFKAYTDRVVAQYGAYEPVKGLHVNGELTLGENMADLAGLNVAYDAYKISLKGKPAPVIGGYTGDQRFFLGFGQIWQNKSREAAIRQQILTDPHTPGAWRPYVARNVDAWYKAFNVKPGQKYYLAPKARIKVW
jgi:putative endopeptidase